MRRVWYVVLLAALALVLALVRPALDAKADYGSGALGNYTGNRVVTTGASMATAGAVIVGDSITARCWTDLDAWLKRNGGPSLAVNYRSGRPVADGLAWLASQHDRPVLTVLALGSNNVMDPPSMTYGIQQGLQSVLDPESLLWVNVEVARTKVDAATQLADQRNTGWINSQLYSALPATQVVPWAETIAAAGRTGRPGWAYYLDDGVHPTTAARTGKGDGCAMWAAVLGPYVKTRYAILTTGKPYTPGGTK